MNSYNQTALKLSISAMVVTPDLELMFLIMWFQVKKEY